MAVAYIAMVCLLGWFQTPAVGQSASPPPTKVQIDNLIPPKHVPNYDTEVLVPLHQAQAQEAAKAAEEARLAEQQAELEATEVRATQASVAPVTGECATWMAQAGITDIPNAMLVVMRESGCNPNAVNSSSGACGIGQQYPCGKWPHAWNDPVGGLIDTQNYVFARYGTWANAWYHELTFHNY